MVNWIEGYREGYGSPERGHPNEAGLSHQGRLPGLTQVWIQKKGKDFEHHHSPGQERVCGEI